MSARDDIARVARENGWHVSDHVTNDGVTIMRPGTDIRVWFTRSGAVATTTRLTHTGEDKLTSRDKGKREAVILWLQATDATDDDGQQTEWCSCTDAPNPDWHDNSCALVLADHERFMGAGEQTSECICAGDILGSWHTTGCPLATESDTESVLSHDDQRTDDPDGHHVHASLIRPGDRVTLWGNGDPHTVAAIIDAGVKGWYSFNVGSNTTLTSTTGYVYLHRAALAADWQRAIVDAYPLDAQDDDVTEQCIDHGTTGGDCELCAETIESAHESEREAWQMTMTIDDDPCTYDQAINLPPAYLPVLDKAFRDNASEVATRLTSLPVLRASITRVETHHPITGTMRRMYQAVVQLDNASRDADLYATAIFRPV